MLLQKSYLSTSVLTMLLTLLVLDFGSENGPWRNLQFLPNWHLPSRNQFLHFSGGYDSLDLERYVKKKNYRLLSLTSIYWSHFYTHFPYLTCKQEKVQGKRGPYDSHLCVILIYKVFINELINSLNHLSPKNS